MKNLRVASRYAKAFLGFVQEHKIVEQAYNDMFFLHKTFHASDELKAIMKSPIVRTAKKLNIINKLFKDKIHPMSLHYLSVITRKNRTSLIEGIAFEYVRLYKDSLNIEIVKLITASEVNEEIEKKALEVAARKTNKIIEFHQESDPDLIGGFILKIGDLQYDASLKRKLLQMKRLLLKS